MKLGSLINPLHYFLTTRTLIRFWFVLSLTIVLTYSLLGLKEGFAGDYLVQDDARQHVFWMRRFIDPNLFPNDLIADYFQAVAPWGYRLVYWLPAQLGIDPFLWNKFLPVILNLITAAFCFGICLELLPIPFAAFSGTVLLAQSLGFTATVVSGTQKAFIYPLFLAFVYLYLKKRLSATLIIIALQGLFYPQILLITAFTLGMTFLSFQGRKLQLIELTVAIIVMVPFALKTNEFSPVITVEQAKQLPEFFSGGRSRFFYPDNWSKFWLEGRSGIRIASALTPVTNALGFCLPILIRFPDTFPLTKQLSTKINLFSQLLFASGIMFLVAHLLLFKLHLPSRYTEHSLRIIFSVTAGLVIVILIDGVIQGIKKTQFPLFLKLFFLFATIFILASPLIFYPLLLNGFPTTAYKTGNTPKLYKFLQKQPQETLVASISGKINNIPTFAQRSILVGSEYAIPYHWGYYKQFRQRTLDLITAQYSPNAEEVAQFIKEYQVTFWLLDKAAFNINYLKNYNWLQQYQPATNNAQKQLDQGTIPVVKTVMGKCRRFEDQQLVLLDTACVLSEIEPS